MAVAEVERVAKVDTPEKPEEGKPERPGGAPGFLGWPGRKLAELRAFFVEVRSELRKVTWPSRKEVYSTTIVVIVTSVLFGFYLWGLDLAFSRAMSLVLAR